MQQQPSKYIEDQTIRFDFEVILEGATFDSLQFLYENDHGVAININTNVITTKNGPVPISWLVIIKIMAINKMFIENFRCK